MLFLFKACVTDVLFAERRIINLGKKCLKASVFSDSLPHNYSGFVASFVSFFKNLLATK